MPLSEGDKLGPYEILTTIGAGGMGQVYRACDPRMGREVAIKVSGDRFSDRFSREVRAVAALNHPNICHLYDVGPDYLVMELVEGQTLEQKIRTGPFSLDEALRIGRQIADALDSAHARGIVHRDLKPANVMLKPDGSVKVLDFGLAQVNDGPVAADEWDVAKSPTISLAATQAGIILGTAPYMSPEQARGEPVDKRADIWAFGVVLYEMITGRRLYDGKSVSDVLAAVLVKEPDLSGVPLRLRGPLRHCLEKDPKRRLRDIGDFEFLLAGSQPPPATASRVRWSSLIGWCAAVVFLFLAAMAWLRTRPPETGAHALALTILPQEGILLDPVGGQAAAPQISPDGTTVLYGAKDALYVRRLDSFHATKVAGSEAYRNAPFWSADSGSVFYPSGDTGALMRVRVPDGAPELVMQLPGPMRGGTQNSKGEILVAASGLCLLTSPGGKTGTLNTSALTNGILRYPEFLPSGDALLFLFLPNDLSGNVIYLASYKDGKLVDPVPLMQNDTAATFTPAGGGNVLFVHDDRLYSQKLDLARRRLVGDSKLIEERVGSGPGRTVGHADFSISRSGTLAWRPGIAELDQVTTFDRQGKVVATTGPPNSVFWLNLAPDETRLLALTDRSRLLDVGQSGHIDLGADVIWQFWSPDGKMLIGSDGEHIFERSTEGSGQIRILRTAKGSLQDLSPNGEHLLTMPSGYGHEIVSLELDVASPGEGETRDVIGVSSGESAFSPAFSPDGNWIVYAARSNDYRSGGIFVQPFPGPGLRRQIAATPGYVQWRRDGKEILFESRGSIYSIAVHNTGDKLSFSPPVQLFSGLRVPPGLIPIARPLAVSRDGSRIFWPQATQQPGPDVIQVKIQAIH
jgi:eukaryotic-like serine/threonine-protein kinase